MTPQEFNTLIKVLERIAKALEGKISVWDDSEDDYHSIRYCVKCLRRGWASQMIIEESKKICSKCGYTVLEPKYENNKSTE